MIKMIFESLVSRTGKNDHAHVIMQDICNKFIDMKFCVVCMVSKPNHLQQGLTAMSLNNKIGSIFVSQISFKTAHF